jgi:hypothetical protein
MPVMMHTPQGLIDLMGNPADWGAPDWGRIARSLSRINRWNGNTTRPYSVAEHSVRVASLVAPRLRLAALLHDAAEAFIGDLPYPIRKQQPAPVFEGLDGKITLWLYTAAGIREQLGHSDIEYADRVMAATEYRDLCGGDPEAVGMAAPLAGVVGQPVGDQAVAWLDRVRGK